MPNPQDDDLRAKAGARHSASDIKRGRGVKAKAREIVKDMDELGFLDEQEIGNPGVAPEDAGKSNALKAISETPDELRVANYIVLFGGRDLEGLGSSNKNADGSRGEFFTRATQFDSEATAKGLLPIDWEHNTMRGQAIDGIAPGEYLGVVDWKTARVDEKGVWVERVLNRRHKYMQWIEALIKQGLIGNSSEAHGVTKAATGEITRYPLVRDTLTVQPMEPRMMTANVVTALKALGVDITDEDAKPKATGPAGAATPSATVEQTPDQHPATKGVLDMDEKELMALLDKRDAARKAADDAEIERKAKEQARIDEAVKAEREKNAREVEALKAEYAKSGRLPMGGQAPIQTHFHDTRKYDGLSAHDLAFTMTLLGEHGKTVSQPAYKALGIKIAEDKSEAIDVSGKAVHLGEDARNDLRSKGIDPAHFLDAAKSNEVNYSTLASGGDEWVGVEYSRRLWPAIRQATWVLQKLPTQEVPQGTESIIIPLESSDPTFYKVAQTTDENATTKTPNASVPSSKLSTAKQTLTVDKLGGRSQYAGEMEEDSLIPWASQLNAQMTIAAAETLEHVAIDGDTETGATTNINTIGGTPAGTEAYLILNGFRKLALVTNAANSTSIGALADTTFLTIKNLMGAAGKNASDKTKVEFILDPNVYDKVLQLASVKTQDVFPNATLVDGELTKLWGYSVRRSYFMHWLSTTNPYQANTAGKVNLTNQALNTTGAALAVRYDQWLMGWKRRARLETVRIPRSDVTEITVTLRVGLVYRDTEAAAIGYNITL